MVRITNHGRQTSRLNSRSNQHQKNLALTGDGRNRRRAIHPSLEEFGVSREFAAIMSATHGDDADQAVEEEGSGIQFSSSQVEDFVKTLSRVEISSLKTDELKCSICKLDYGEEKANSTEPGSDSDKRLPGEGPPEHPVKLSCGHVFGNWCIKTWLLLQPASCPPCRFHFQPVE